MATSQTNLSEGVVLLPADDKQQPYAVKQIAVTGVHNQNGVSLASHQDPVKIFKTKKLPPENPPNFCSQFSFSNNAGNEHIVNARRRFELELGKGRSYLTEKYAGSLQQVQACQPQEKNPIKQTQLKESSKTRVPVATKPPTKSSCGGPLVPNHVKVSAEIPQNTCSKPIIEQRMSDRFNKLQQFLKQCDEPHHRGYLEVLLKLSPPDLSRHAVELEKRAIHLGIEEAKELDRMKSLNTMTQYPIRATQSSRK